MLFSTRPFATPSVMVRPRSSGNPIDQARSPCAGISLRSFRGGNSRSSAATMARSFRTSMASTRSDPGAAVTRQVFQPVLSRVQHGLRHDVIVRHDPAPIVDGETAAVECARFGLVEETANLHHGVARRVEPDLRVARELLVRDVGIDRGRVDRVGVRRLLPGRLLGG